MTIDSTIANQISALPSTATGLIPLTLPSNSPFTLLYDATNQRLQVQPVRIGGGFISLTGAVASTALGQIDVLGGYGHITVNNSTNVPVDLEGLDDSQSGAGTLLINDTAKGIASVYQKSGNEVTTTINGVTTTSTGTTYTYSPETGLRYGWAVGQAQDVIKEKTTGASSTWLGIDALEADPPDSYRFNHAPGRADAHRRGRLLLRRGYDRSIYRWEPGKWRQSLLSGSDLYVLEHHGQYRHAE